MAISAEAVAHHAATTAMYAAESLGLGTRMIGVVHPLVQYGKKQGNSGKSMEQGMPAGRNCLLSLDTRP